VLNMQSDVVQILSDLGISPADAAWTPQTGGRTNQVWRVDFGTQSLICKLFRKPDGNPLFPNFAQAEFDALTALKGANIAPEPVAIRHTLLGDIVVYRHLSGQPWVGDAREIAALLARLHQQPPYPSLRRLPSGSAALIRQIRQINAMCHTPISGFKVSDPCVAPVARDVMIHTDVVAANIVATPDGPRLIDWQCPAQGDACEDLASFLSPAMQHLYGRPPMSPDQADAFLAAYPDATVRVRFQSLARLFHLRVAAYCQWKTEQGDSAYQQALKLERSAIDQIDRHKQKRRQKYPDTDISQRA